MDNILNKINIAIANKTFPGAVVLYGNNLETAKFVAAGNFTYKKSSPLVTRNTIYDIASLTKMFTATATLILASEKNIKLNEEINKILKITTFPNVTIKHLLTHTSGIQLSLSSLKNLSKEKIEHIALFSKPKVTPGEQIYYSDPGYFILGKALEKATNSSLDQLFEKLIFKPLGLTSTMFNPPKNLHNKVAPTEIDKWRGGIVQGEVHTESAYKLGGVTGYSGLFSTADDVFKLGTLWLNKGKLNGKQTIDESLVNEACSIHYPSAENLTLTQMSFGYGWRLHNNLRMGKYASKASYELSGFTGPSVLIDPKNSLIVVILDNRTYPKRKNKDEWLKAHRSIIEEIYKNLN